MKVDKEALMSRQELLKLTENVLRRLQPSDVKELVLRQYPGASWGALETRLQETRQQPTPRTVAAALVAELAEMRLQKQHLRDSLANIRLLATSLSSKVEWQAYALQGVPSEAPSFSRLGECVGEALNLRVRVLLGRGGAELLGLGERCAVLQLHRQRATLLVAARGKDPAKLIQGLTTALGYSKLKNLHLSGRHPPSLLQMAETKRGARGLEAVLREPQEQRGPRVTPLGLDFTGWKPAADQFGQSMGPTPPSLQMLTVEAAVIGQMRPLRSTLRLTSPDVTQSVQDMLAAGLVTSAAPLVTMLAQEQRTKASIIYQD